MKPRVVHQYLKYRPTGQLWAVEVVEGSLRGACGPLDANEVTPRVLPLLMFDFRDVRWIRDHPHEFVPEALSA